MKDGAGFMILEVMIYIFLLSFLALISMSFFVRVNFLLNHQNNNLKHITAAYNALDVVARIVEDAPALKNIYKRFDEHCIVWHDLKSDKDIGIEYKNNKLVKIKGLYDMHDQQWHGKRVQILLDDVSFCSVVHTEQSSLLGTLINSFVITMKTKFNQQKITKFAYLTQRVL